MNRLIIFLCYFIFPFCIVSCVDDELLKQNVTKCGVTINVQDFKNETM